MIFLERYWKRLIECFCKKIKAATILPLEANEPIDRFLFSKKLYNSRKNIVKPRAFMPPNNRKEVSVFRTGGLDESQIWELANKTILSAQSQKRTLHGRAEITPLIVNNVGLNLVSDDKPRRHANIVGWPSEKDEQKMYATELASKSTLKLKCTDSDHI